MADSLSKVRAAQSITSRVMDLRFEHLFCQRSRQLGGPAFEKRDLLVGPCAVAGHRASAKPKQYLLPVHDNVRLLPEVEREQHRVTVHRPKQRTNMIVEANGFVCARQC